MTPPSPMTRRKALGSIASLASISIVPSRVLGLNGQTPPSEELTRALIGCGGISASHLGMPGRILAVCDVDSQRLAQRLGQAQNGQEAGRTFLLLRSLMRIPAPPPASPPRRWKELERRRHWQQEWTVNGLCQAQGRSQCIQCCSGHGGFEC